MNHRLSYLFQLLEKTYDEFEYSFEHNGHKAIAMFDVLDPGFRAGGPYYGRDPESSGAELKFRAAYLEDDDKEIQLSPKEIEQLESDAAEEYYDQHWVRGEW